MSPILPHILGALFGLTVALVANLIIYPRLAATYQREYPAGSFSLKALWFTYRIVMPVMFTLAFGVYGPSILGAA